MTRFYKILTGLECCKNENCKECRYRSYRLSNNSNTNLYYASLEEEKYDCRRILLDDTVELLKYIQNADFDFNVYMNKEV